MKKEYRPSEPMKILIRRLGGGDPVVATEYRNAKKQDLVRYCHTKSKIVVHWEVLERAVETGFVRRNKDNTFTLSDTGLAIYRERNGNFKFWNVGFTNNVAEINEKYGDSKNMLLYLRWSVIARPMGEDGPISHYRLNVSERDWHPHIFLDGAIQEVKKVLIRRAGFNTDEVVFEPLSAEMTLLNQQQTSLFAEREDARIAAYEAFKSQQKAEAQMDESHILMQPVTMLDLHKHTLNILSANKIGIIADLISIHEDSFTKLKGAGRKTLWDVKYALFELRDEQIHLGCNIPEWQQEEVARLKLLRLNDL